VVLRALCSVSILLLAGLLSAGCFSGDEPDRGSRQATFETVTPADVAPRVESGEVLLVDVREDAEWAAGRAPGAMHVPLDAVAGQLEQVRKAAAGRPVAFICRSGRRSAEAARIAAESGLPGVINVDGGMSGWVDAGLPIRPRKGRVL
jgi:rhodanese-related sulfurtransferase